MKPMSKPRWTPGLMSSASLTTRPSRSQTASSAGFGCRLTSWRTTSILVHALQQRYAGQLEIRLGLESEYFPRYHDHLLRMREQGIGYYILGQHYADSEEDNPYIGFECQTDEGVLRYAQSAVAAMRTGLFCYIAHPDLFMRHRTDDQFNRACEEAADMLCQCAKEQHMPIEYNLLGLNSQMEGHTRGYPSAPFWEYARKWHNDVILGVDAHDPERPEKSPRMASGH